MSNKQCNDESFWYPASSIKTNLSCSIDYSITFELRIFYICSSYSNIKFLIDSSNQIQIFGIADIAFSVSYKSILSVKKTSQHYSTQVQFDTILEANISH